MKEENPVQTHSSPVGFTTNLVVKCFTATGGCIVRLVLILSGVVNKLDYDDEPSRAEEYSWVFREETVRSHAILVSISSINRSIERKRDQAREPTSESKFERELLKWLAIRAGERKSDCGKLVKPVQQASCFKLEEQFLIDWHGIRFICLPLHSFSREPNKIGSLSNNSPNLNARNHSILRLAIAD